MALWYEPELIDHRLESFEEDGKHYVSGFLIGTKTGDKGWGVHRDTFIQNTKLFEGFPFIVSPKEFDPTEHFLIGATYKEQMERQKDVTRGVIEEISDPIPYNDGTDDVYVKFRARIDDKLISDAMIEGKLPFGTSPYIWPLDKEGNEIDPATLSAEERAHVKYWKPVHEALVTKGTFGDIAKIGKQCFGPQGVCKQALAGSSAQVASYLSSQIDIAKQQSSNTMNEQTKVNSETPKPEQVQAPQVNSTASQAPINPIVAAPKVEEKKEEVNQEFETVKKELADKDKIIQKLLIKDRINTLNTIFTNFDDEETRKITIKKYQDHDADFIAEVAADVLKYGIPKKQKKELDDNKLAGSSKDKTVTFPLTGNSKLNENEEQSLTNLMGGIVK